MLIQLLVISRWQLIKVSQSDIYIFVTLLDNVIYIVILILCQLCCNSTAIPFVLLRCEIADGRQVL